MTGSTFINPSTLAVSLIIQRSCKDNQVLDLSRMSTQYNYQTSKSKCPNDQFACKYIAVIMPLDVLRTYDIYVHDSKNRGLTLVIGLGFGAPPTWPSLHVDKVGSLA
jgi:hypothetical protein